MLEETVEGWTREWEAQGYRKGLEAGRQAGLEAGRQAGLETGLEVGRQETRNLFLRLLETKFDALSAEIRPRIMDARPEELERWSERLLRVDSVDALFDESR